MVRYFLIAAASVLALYNWSNTENGREVIAKFGQPAEGSSRVWR